MHPKSSPIWNVYVRIFSHKTPVEVPGTRPWSKENEVRHKIRIFLWFKKNKNSVCESEFVDLVDSIPPNLFKLKVKAGNHMLGKLANNSTHNKDQQIQTEIILQ